MRSVEAAFANARDPSVKLISPHHAEIIARSADDSGEIRVMLMDGKNVTCRVGYVTNGESEPHKLTIRDGHCHVPQASIG